MLNNKQHGFNKRQNVSSPKIVAEINVVPYIDVMLVLLIIFMVTAPLLQQGVAVDLPKAGAKTIDSKNQEPIILSVDKNANYFLNISDNPQVPVELKAMMLRVKASLVTNPERQVLVKGDTGVNYGQVVAAMVALQNAGAPSVGLVTQDDDAAKG